MLNQQQRILQRDLGDVADRLQQEGYRVTPYNDIYRKLLSNHGKMIRASLALIFHYACADRSGVSNDSISSEHSHVGIAAEASDAAHSKAIVGAAAIEMLHLSTLVHDDVLDNAPIRRGKPAVQTILGNKSAIYLGDLLLSRYMEIMAQIAPDTAFIGEQAHDVNEIVKGDLYQESMRHHTAITYADYERSISGKTATLFELACLTGVRLSVRHPEESILKQASAFGHELGLAFQIIDDIEDFDVSHDTGKPKLEDIRDGIYTLPVILALHDDAYFKKVLEANNPSLVLDYLTKHPEYLQRSKDEAKRHLEKSKKLLRDETFPQMPSSSRSLLDSIVDRLIASL